MQVEKPWKGGLPRRRLGEGGKFAFSPEQAKRVEGAVQAALRGAALGIEIEEK